MAKFIVHQSKKSPFVTAILNKKEYYLAIRTELISRSMAEKRLKILKRIPFLKEPYGEKKTKNSLKDASIDQGKSGATFYGQLAPKYYFIRSLFKMIACLCLIMMFTLFIKEKPRWILPKTFKKLIKLCFRKNET